MRTLRSFKIPTVVLAWLLALAALSEARGSSLALQSVIVISARAEATYRDEFGNLLTTSSDTVTITVAAVAGLTVTPDESASSSTIPPLDRVAELFEVCNTGNQADSFTVASATITAPASLATLYFDLDGSGTLT